MSWDKPSSGGSDHPGSPRPGEDRNTAGRESRDAPVSSEAREGDRPPQADRTVPGHRLRNAWDYVREGTVTTDPIPGRPIRRETDPPPALDHRAGYVPRVPESASRDAGLLRGDAFARDRPAAARPETTDRQAGRPETADRQADRKPDRVQQLETELRETRTERSQLIEAVTRQTARIEKLESQVDRLENHNDKLSNSNDRLRAENDRLRSELAEARNDKQAEVPSAVAGKQRDAGDETEVTGELDRKRMRLPSSEAVSVITGAVGGVDAVATATHVMTSSEGTIVGAASALGAAAYMYAKSKWEKRHDDKPGA